MKSTVQTDKGFTLLELMVAVAIVAILASVAVPSMSDYITRGRLLSATEAIYSNFQLSRSIALARNDDISVVFGGTGTTTWCMAVSDDIDCDCTKITPTNVSGTATAAKCTLQANISGTTTDVMVLPYLSGADYGGVTLDTNFTDHKTGFQMPRGISLDNGTVTLSNTVSGTVETTEVKMSTLGRAKICSDSLSRYKDC